MKTLYKFHFKIGRHDTLDGIFIEDSEIINTLISSKVEIYFGEVNGKHSEIVGCLEEPDIEEITTDPTVLDIFEKYNLATGYNPTDYCIGEFENAHTWYKDFKS